MDVAPADSPRSKFSVDQLVRRVRTQLEQIVCSKESIVTIIAERLSETGKGIRSGAQSL